MVTTDHLKTTTEEEAKTMASVGEVTKDILRKRLEAMNTCGDLENDMFYEHIWTKDFVTDGKKHVLEFYIASGPNFAEVNLRLAFGDMTHCPARTIATFKWNLVGATGISNAVEAIVNSYGSAQI